MTYLELCKKLVQRAGISGTIQSAQGQSGEMLRVVGWVDDAYRYVLNKHRDWEFLRQDVSFTTSGMVREYTAATAGVTQFGEWRFTNADGYWNWSCWAADAGTADEQPLAVMTYDAFKRHYGFGAARDDVGRPQVVAMKPDQSLVFWPTPPSETPYWVSGEQYRVPPALVADGDEPVFPARFHDAILYRALMLYAEFEGDGVTFNTAQLEAGRYLAMLESVYLPDITVGSPMA